MEKGIIKSSNLLIKKVEFLSKHTKKLNLKKDGQIYTNKYFLEIKPFINHNFMIESKKLLNILKGILNKENNEYFILKNENEKYLILKSSNKKIEKKEKILITNIEEIKLEIDEPLISFELKKDFLKFLKKLELDYLINLKIEINNNFNILICEINENFNLKFVQENFKIGIKNVENLEIVFRKSEILFLNELENAVFCIFDDYLIVYNYDFECTLAVRVPLLNN